MSARWPDRGPSGPDPGHYADTPIRPRGGPTVGRPDQIRATGRTHLSVRAAAQPWADRTRCGPLAGEGCRRIAGGAPRARAWDRRRTSASGQPPQRAGQVAAARQARADEHRVGEPGDAGEVLARAVAGLRHRDPLEAPLQ